MTLAASNNPSPPSDKAGQPPKRPGFESVRMSARRCLTCQREAEPGELMNAVLVELPRQDSAGGQFQRLNYCSTCWADSPWLPGATALLDEGQSAVAADLFGASPIAIWAVRVSPVDKKPRRAFVDDAVLMNFFLRLNDDPDPVRQQFRFVLMLILLRHRRLRHEGTTRSADGDIWRVRLMPAMAEAAGVSADEIYPVVDPRMNEDQVGQVAEQLGQILQEDLDTDT